MNSTGIRLAGIALLSISTSGAAFADCSTDSPATCFYVHAGARASVSPAAFANPNPSCQEITNNCGGPIMVPTTSQAEWSSFIDNHEVCAAVAACDTYSAVNPVYGTCSGVCGGGSGTEALQSWQCKNIGTGAIVANSRCVSPINSQPCVNSTACPVCSPISIANGTVGAYPDCSVTCDAGYAWNGRICAHNTCTIYGLSVAVGQQTCGGSNPNSMGSGDTNGAYCFECCSANPQTLLTTRFNGTRSAADCGSVM